MADIQAIDVNPTTGVYVRAREGIEVTITPAEILTRAALVVGDRPTKRLVTREWIASRVEQFLGPQFVFAAEFDCDFSVDDGRPFAGSVGLPSALQADRVQREGGPR